MGSLKALFSRRRHSDRAQVAGRAAVVIDHVIHDVGIHSLVNGKFVLDKSFRLRFHGAANAPEIGVIASVRVNTLAEAQLLEASAEKADLPVLDLHKDGLINAVLREFSSQSPAFRALPAAR